MDRIISYAAAGFCGIRKVRRPRNDRKELRKLHK